MEILGKFSLIILCVLLFILLLAIVLLILFICSSIDYVFKGDEKEGINGLVKTLFGGLQFQLKKKKKLKYKIKVFGVVVLDSSKSKNKSGATQNDDEKDIKSKEEFKEEDLLEKTLKEDLKDSNFFQKMKFKFYYKVGSLNKKKEKLDRLKELLSSEQYKEPRDIIKTELFSLISKFKPAILEGELKFGFDSPDITGIVYGIISIVLAKIKKTIKITPTFSHKDLGGDFHIEGSVKNLDIIKSIYKILKNKKCRIFIKNFRSLKSNKHNKSNKMKDDGHKDNINSKGLAASTMDDRKTIIKYESNKQYEEKSFKEIDKENYTIIKRKK